MELQFPKMPCAWLRQVGGDTRDLEQTLEVKLPDAMPDIGKVLCGWGQALVRSKQWNRDSVGVSGGVMAWVLYLPEDGGEMRSVECWIPFQNRWDIQPGDHDGAILVQCYLKGVDARSLSARKLMVRANLAVTARAVTEEHRDIPQWEEQSGDVQLLKKTWEITVPREAGEKIVNLEETIPAPTGQRPQKVLHYWLHPSVTDCKLMADRAVFRGTALGHCLYRGEEGGVHGWDFEIPFSQYSELDREYGPEAKLQVTMLPTGLEMEVSEEGGLHVKGSLTGQYMVYDKQTLETVADAYSTLRESTVRTEQLELPQAVHFLENKWHAEGVGQTPASQVLSCGFFLDPPTPNGTGEPADLSGRWQVLSRDGEDNICCDAISWKGEWELPGDLQARLWAWQSGFPSAQAGSTPAAQTELAGMGTMETVQTIPMVTGLTLGAERERPADRPSIVLRRAGTGSLWYLAKQFGTTVEAIMNANGLTQEPVEGNWLLIPIP